MRNFLSIVLLLSVVLAGCGSGGSDSGSAPASPDSTVADAEATRVAAIYRYMQGLGSLMLANLTELDIGESRAGAQACTGGGSVTYSDTTTSPGADPSAAISFDDCVEAMGLINGTMDLRQFLIRLNEDGVGSFNVSWSADVVIAGYAMTFESNSGLVTRSPGGAVKVETFGGADLAMSLTAPSGASVLFSDVRIDIAYDPGTGLADFGGSNVRMRALSTSELGAKLLPTGLRAATTLATAACSIGAPVSGSFAYQRSFDQTATDVLASGTTHDGVLDLAVDPLPASYSFPGSAGQYAWSVLLESPDLTLPAEAP